MTIIHGRHPGTALRTLMASTVLLASAGAQTLSPDDNRPPIGTTNHRLVLDEATRIADPKLAGGGVEVAFRLLPASASAPAVVEIWQGATLVDTVWSGTVDSGTEVEVVWGGREPGGDWCDTGEYTLRLSAPGLTSIEAPLDLVRLGITEIEAQDSPAGNDEWQMVYFKKGSLRSYFATPAIHEYLNVADDGEVSDLDLDNGDPRPTVGVHGGTAEPVMEGADYHDDGYNYPLAYIMGTSPRLELTFGASATTAAGTPMGTGYPVTGYEIRARAEQEGVEFHTDAITPGGTAIVDLPPLPGEVLRKDLDVTFSWQYREVGGTDWSDIPGATTVPFRVYTLLDEPNFKEGPTGTRYTGPWVEAAEYITSWRETLGFTANDAVSLTEVHIHGFVGQNSGIPAPIEGVLYDAFPLGGDGGATHYFLWGVWNMNLSALFDGHANGVYVNCTDNMGATTTMLAMMGVDNMRPVRLGPMNLKAIWGIGAPAYTTDLWGPGNHGFSYHHIVTDDDAVTVSDTCMQLDEDGSPESTPGTPGWNHHRIWQGAGIGYNNLSSYNNTSTELESLPGLK